MIQEQLRMQMLAGVITEGEYKTKLQENEMAAVGEKVEAAVEDKLEATVDNLSDEQKSQLRAELAKAGITANSKIEDVVSKLDESLNEVEGDTKTKVANTLSNVGGALMKSMLVPLIPLVVGKITGTGFGGGVAITAGTAGALIALAKLLGTEKTQDSLNEHMIGGIVGIGAINQIPPREKANYETAFEHFLGQKYGINEMEGDVEEDLQQTDVKSAIDGKKLDLDKLKDATEKAMKGDSTDLTLFLAGVFEGKEVEEKSLYEGEVNEDIRAIVTKIFDNISSNSEKENNDLIELGNAIFTPEGAKIVANAIKFKLKQTDQIPGQMYYGDKEELDAFLSKLK
jgi:hypothetical protein